MYTSHMRQVILTKEDHQTAVGDLLFIADQIALDENIRLAGPGGTEAQAKQA